MTALLLLCLILCDSPIVPLNNWKLRTCLFCFLLGQHLPILVFFSSRSIALVTQPEKMRVEREG